jgi:hypothetical protein
VRNTPARGPSNTIDGADEILTISDGASGDLVQRPGKDGPTERIIEKPPSL